MKFKRRNFLQLFGASLAASALPQSIKAQSDAFIVDKDFDFSCLPYLQALSPHEVTIVSLTNKNAFTWVELMDNNNTGSTKHVDSQDGLITANTTLTKIKIENLRPDTTYQYQVFSKEITSFQPYKLTYGSEIKTQTYTFKTPALKADLVSCLIYNDVHERPEIYPQLYNLKGNIQPDFVVLNGDMFDYQTSEEQLINKLLQPISKTLNSSIPFILNRGNHETRGSFARDIKKYFAYPEHDYYQAFKQGPVFWILLDSGEDKPDTHEVYAGITDFDKLREKQSIWLEKVMQSTDFQQSLYKVVVMHIPPFHSGDWHGPLENRRLFTPLFEKHKIDVVISGHTHRHGYHEPDNDHSYPIFIGGSPKEGSRTLISVQADREKLSVKMILDNGNQIGEFEKKA